MNIHEIAERVRETVARHTFDGITLEVDESRIIDDGPYWRIPLIPSAWPKRLFPLYEVFAEIEEDLRGEQGLPVLLIVGEPRHASPREVVAV